MKILKYITPGSLAIAMAVALGYGCLPESSDQDLGPKPVASFEVTPISGKVNTFLLKNTSQNGFHFQWDKGQGFVEGRETDTAYFGFEGNYEVKLRVLGSGGVDMASKSVNVATTDPDLCTGTPAKENLGKLTGCGTKTWVLIHDAGALTVGPPDGGVWWSSGVGDVTAADRTCLFNDEYTFSANGNFTFDDLGDFRVDDEGGAAWPTDVGLGIGCYNTTQIPQKYQAWGSGNHKFGVTANTLTVTGLGAHLGLYKVGQNGTTAVPEQSNTYEIVELTDTKLVVKKAYSWGYWKFVLVPKE